MKFLRLYSDDAVCDKSGFTWNIPLLLEHQQVGMSSIHVEFRDDAVSTGVYIPRVIPIQCSLIKENMWNTSGVFYNLDLEGGNGTATAARSNEIGESYMSHCVNK